MGLCTFSWRNFKFPSTDGACLLLSTVPRLKCPVFDSTWAQVFQWKVEQALRHFWKWFNFCIEIDYEQAGSFSWRGETSSRRDNIVSCLRSVWAWCCTLYMGCVSFLLVICPSGLAVLFSLLCFLNLEAKIAMLLCIPLFWATNVFLFFTEGSLPDSNWFRYLPRAVDDRCSQ